MKKTIQLFKKIWNDESGQGATEYILLLVIVVGIALLFRNQIQQIITDKISEVGSGISSFSINQ